MLLVDMQIDRALFHVAPVLADIVATLCFVSLPLVLLIRAADQVLIAAVLTLLVGSILRSKYWIAIFQKPLIFTFGGMCYTTYLYHGFFKALPGHFTIRWQIGNAFWLNFLTQFALLTPIIVVGSAVLFLVTEKPFMRRSPKSPKATISTPAAS